MLRLSKGSHGFTFQQLNARSHKARVAMSFRQHQSIDVMPYHLRLPDLNPIYHIFDELNIVSMSKEIQNIPTIHSRVDYQGIKTERTLRDVSF